MLCIVGALVGDGDDDTAGKSSVRPLTADPPSPPPILLLPGLPPPTVPLTTSLLPFSDPLFLLLLLSLLGRFARIPPPALGPRNRLTPGASLRGFAPVWL